MTLVLYDLIICFFFLCSGPNHYVIMKIKHWDRWLASLKDDDYLKNIEAIKLYLAVMSIYVSSLYITCHRNGVTKVPEITVYLFVCRSRICWMNI